ncbi:MAG TPA: hypothetical protein VHY08_29085 [Bacillota bacterium]|nr:hypothetical protein [Bacillota bacterium]
MLFIHHYEQGSSDVKTDLEFIRRLEEVIETNLANPNFNVAKLSRQLYIRI